MMNQNLYYIAIVLPDEASQKIVAVQIEIAERFQSKKALANVPHITLKAPFTLPAAEHGTLLDWFSELVLELAPFDIELNGFGVFNNPKHPVIYVRPQMNVALAALQKMIVRQFSYQFPHVPVSNLESIFKPHVTVAYRDLLPELFKEAWEVFQDRPFFASFRAEQFQLLQHDTKRWHIIKIHDLDGSR